MVTDDNDRLDVIRLRFADISGSDGDGYDVEKEGGQTDVQFLK